MNTVCLRKRFAGILLKSAAGKFFCFLFWTTVESPPTGFKPDSQCQPPLLGAPGGGLLTLLQARSPRIPGSWGVLEETTEFLFARVEP